MRNGINPYQQSRIHAFTPPKPAQARSAAEPSAPSQAAAPAKAAAPGLSAEEQQMIDRYFPETPSLSMRLYGPGRTAQTLQPNALGSRLDLRG